METTTIKNQLLDYNNKRTIYRYLCCIFNKERDDFDEDFDEYIPTWSINKGTD